MIPPSHFHVSSLNMLKKGVYFLVVCLYFCALALIFKKIGWETKNKNVKSTKHDWNVNVEVTFGGGSACSTDRPRTVVWKLFRYHPSVSLALRSRSLQLALSQTVCVSVTINVWKVFHSHIKKRTASICTNELWEVLKSFTLLDSLKFKVALYPKIVSLDTLIWREHFAVKKKLLWSKNRDRSGKIVACFSFRWQMWDWLVLAHSCVVPLQQCFTTMAAATDCHRMAWKIDQGKLIGVASIEQTWHHIHTFSRQNQPGAMKLVIWRHWMHVTQVHLVSSARSFPAPGCWFFRITFCKKKK